MANLFLPKLEPCDNPVPLSTIWKKKSDNYNALQITHFENWKSFYDFNNVFLFSHFSNDLVLQYYGNYLKTFITRTVLTQATTPTNLTVQTAPFTRLAVWG